MLKATLTTAAALTMTVLPALAEPGQKDTPALSPATISTSNAGHQMSARLLDLDADAYSPAELGRVATIAEGKRGDVLSFIDDSRNRELNTANSGHRMLAALEGLSADDFTAAELAVIAGADNADRAEVIAFIKGAR